MLYFAIQELVLKIHFLSMFQKFMFVFVLWFFLWPGPMFWVGWIFESRRVPVWRGQSKAFIPGDLSLAVMLFALLELHIGASPESWGYSLFWWIPLTVVMLVIFHFVRKADIANYPPRSRTSPTKIIHDAMGYFYFPWMLVGLGVPRIIPAIKDFQTYGSALVVFFVALIFYIGCFVIDSKIGWTKEDVLARHPENWKPIWRHHRR